MELFLLFSFWFFMGPPNIWLFFWRFFLLASLEPPPSKKDDTQQLKVLGSLVKPLEWLGAVGVWAPERFRGLLGVETMWVRG